MLLGQAWSQLVFYIMMKIFSTRKHLTPWCCQIKLVATGSINNLFFITQRFIICSSYFFSNQQQEKINSMSAFKESGFIMLDSSM